MAGESLRVALARHYVASGFEEPSVERRWVTFKVGFVPLAFPNSRARVRAVRLHDLHHLATGYGTDLRGEGEQSAWELAAGCHHHWFAWGINLFGAAVGFLVAPRRTVRAFRRGRRCTTLYDGEFHEALLDGSVKDLRLRLNLAASRA